MEWQLFKHFFLEQYFPLVERWLMKVEFLELAQKGTTVMEYEARFTASSRFAQKMVATKAVKCEHFEQGLRPTIHERLAAHIYTNYSQLVTATMRVKAQKNQARKIQEKNHPEGGSSNGHV